MKSIERPDEEMWDDDSVPADEVLSFDEVFLPPDEGGIQTLSFEEAFTRLKEVVTDLESGSMTLDEATKKYEEGMKLAQTCNRFLAQTELKMTELRSIYLDEPPASASPPI
jgi:exodeoxyribonuclease VII small subunit